MDFSETFFFCLSLSTLLLTSSQLLLVVKKRQNDKEEETRTSEVHRGAAEDGRHHVHGGVPQGTGVVAQPGGLAVEHGHRIDKGGEAAPVGVAKQVKPRNRVGKPPVHPLHGPALGLHAVVRGAHRGQHQPPGPYQAVVRLVLPLHAGPPGQHPLTEHGKGQAGHGAGAGSDPAGRHGSCIGPLEDDDRIVFGHSCLWIHV